MVHVQWRVGFLKTLSTKVPLGAVGNVQERVMLTLSKAAERWRRRRIDMLLGHQGLPRHFQPSDDVDHLVGFLPMAPLILPSGLMAPHGLHLISAMDTHSLVLLFRVIVGVAGGQAATRGQTKTDSILSCLPSSNSA